MAEFEDQIGQTTLGFAEVSSRATAASNARRLDIAEGNIQAGVNQIELQETVQRREVSRSLAQFQGGQAASRAFRGGGGLGSGQAIVDAATAQAADQAAIIEANAANKEIALVAANQVKLDDPVLAAIRGGIEGLNLGTQIANALIQEAEVKQRQSSRQIEAGGALRIPTFQNTITNVLEIPGLNINEFLSGINLETGNAKR